MRISARLGLSLAATAAAVLLLGERLGVRERPFGDLLAAATIAWLAALIVHWQVARPLEGLARWMGQLRAGEELRLPAATRRLQPLVAEARALAKSLLEARGEAASEARLRHESEGLWTAERLKEHARTLLEGRGLVLLANREPYEHVRRGKGLVIRTPASGVVTALEPVLRACGGVWIAHGSGDADFESSDERGRLGVPPGEPQYTLRRIWIPPQEEQGYYYGFANEGLWPLCHVAFTRPLFDESDWRDYQSVNRRFADAALDEIAGSADPFVLVQDYHFALAPRMIKAARPDARVALFWHIPWPNAEAFSICPWEHELLDGILGADLVGFHIQSHCNNFLETVDRALECRVDKERVAVSLRGRETLVRALPISVAWPWRAAEPGPPKAELLRRLGLRGDLLGVGVDRVDYTKGLLERFAAIERLLERYPEFLGRLVFAQLAAPSRTLIPRYHDLLEEVRSEAERVNLRFAGKQWRPIAFLEGHHSRDDIEPYYRAADFCLVSSLHDGMNLVAKEFVSSRDDELGVLLLSRFTGASRELRDALTINPYDAGAVAEAIRIALTMEPAEQRRRMGAMRRHLKSQNAYQWAARLLEELSKVRR